MTSAKTSAPSRDELQTDLAIARETEGAALAEQGRRRLAGQNIDAATEKVAAARAQIDALEAAIVEVETLEAAAADEKSAAVASTRRIEAYGHLAEYARALRSVVSAQQALKAAREGVRAVGLPRDIGRAMADPQHSDLDWELLHGLPAHPPSSRGDEAEERAWRSFGERLSLEGVEKALARAEHLIDAEKRGKAAGVPGAEFMENRAEQMRLQREEGKRFRQEQERERRERLEKREQEKAASRHEIRREVV
jgi:hypothetical protein